MKKLISINIAGKIFQINDDAYAKLEAYLTHLKNYFSKEEGGSEIIEDMEVRMSELLDSHTNFSELPVSKEHVEKLISVIGDPSQFDPQEENKQTKDGQDHQKTYQENARNGSRSLYRDPDDRVIFGVCSGLSYYFNIDVMLVRIVFAVAFFFGLGSPVLLYIIMAMIIPKANTYAEKARMTKK